MRTFPLVPDGKPPAVRDWEHRASADPRSIDDWPRRTTGYGVACGPSGLYVVDCDKPKPDTPPPPESAADAVDGYEALLLLAGDLGRPMLRETLTVRTGRGGLHLYYPASTSATARAASRGWSTPAGAAGTSSARAAPSAAGRMR
jgi:hypothetical protein